MKIIVPRAFVAANVTTNVSLTETAWTAGTYGIGTRRYAAATFDLYEVVATAGTTDSPTVGYAKDPKTWDRVGKVNRFACFDGIVGNPTVAAGGIDMTIASDGTITNGIAFFGVSGATLRVTVTDPTDGVVYDQTVALSDNSGVGSWYDWYFGPIITVPDVVLIDLPLYGSADIRVRITGSASLGEMVLGRLTDLGTTGWGTQVGILDFSRKDRDTFGNAILIRRAFAKLATYAAKIATPRVVYATRVLSDRRGLPTVFIGSENRPETVVYGFFRDITVTLAGPGVSECSIEVEGLV